MVLVSSPKKFTVICKATTKFGLRFTIWTNISTESNETSSKLKNSTRQHLTPKCQRTTHRASGRSLKFYNWYALMPDNHPSRTLSNKSLISVSTVPRNSSNKLKNHSLPFRLWGTLSQIICFSTWQKMQWRLSSRWLAIAKATCIRWVDNRGIFMFLVLYLNWSPQG